MGLGPATDVTLEAYDGDRSLNQRLEPFNQSYRRIAINRLEPGESKEVDIVWDPPSYKGLGHHDIHFVVDPFNKIDESSEENNESRFTVTLHDLPDLSVDPWMGHWMQLTADNGVPLWGQNAKLIAQVNNIGDSDAEYVRVSMIYNQNELTGFSDDIPQNAMRETSFDVPVFSARNTMLIVADKYDLIGEKNEKNSYGNNISTEKRLYLQLRMPETPIDNGQRVYTVKEENEYSAGLGEFIRYNSKKKELFLHADIEDAVIRIEPAFVADKNSFTYFFSNEMWLWNTKYNAFYSPPQSENVLRTELPAPNGRYDVYVQLYSSGYNEGATEHIKIKTQFDKDFIDFAHAKTDDPKAFRKIGTYDIQDDKFLLDFKSVTTRFPTSLGDVRYLRSLDNKPASGGYLSPFFSAEGSGSGPAVMSWEAEIPMGTNLTVKARWANQKEDESIGYLPWARTVHGGEGQLLLPGKGDYFQYYVSFIRETRDQITPVFRNVKIIIPCQEVKKKTKIGPAR